MRETVPTEFTAGESLSWKKSYADYPASDGWSLDYVFRGAGKGFDRAATADGDIFIVNVAGVVTEAMTAGKYYYQASVSKGDEKILVDSGETLVLPGLATIAADESFDGRSQIKRTLDAIGAMIAGKATLDQQEYTIGPRQLRRYPISELITLRDKYQSLYNQELRAEKLKKGTGGVFKNHYTRFRQPR